MALMLELTLEKRDLLGKKLAASRRAGKLPVVVYGPSMKVGAGSKHKSASYFLELKDFKKIWQKAGESVLVSLITGETEAGKKKIDVLIHAVAHHPLSGEPIHADFYAVDTTKPVEVHVALDFVGVSPAVKNLGANLVKVMHEIEIRVLPKHLVHEIKVDISKLEKFGDKIHVSDIILPESAELITPAEEAVALVKEVVEEKEEEVAPVDLTKIEVEKKGKEPKEGEEAVAEAPAKAEKSDKKTEKK